MLDGLDSIDEESSFTDLEFSAVQTHTLFDDGTYTAEVHVETATAGTIDDQTLPMSSSGTGTMTGTWSVRGGRFVATADSTDGTGTVTRGEHTIDMPNPSSLGNLILVPTDPYPVTCTDRTMTIDVDLSPVIPGAPHQLVSTRQ